MASFEIKRRNGEVHTVLVDDADLERVLAAGPWHVDSYGYAIRNVQNGARRSSQLLHRWLLGLPPRTPEVDHANGNRLDNRRGNLRPATRSQNMQNTKTPTTNTSGLRGAFWHKKTGRWTSSINVNGRQKYLGLFDTREEAHAAYCKAAKAAFGEFARFG